MKKVFAFILVVALVAGMAISGSAATDGIRSPGAAAEDLKPFLVSSSCDQTGIYSAEEIAELPEEIQQIMAEAKAKLSEAVPAGMAVRYFVYLDICEICGNATVELQLDGYSELVIKMFVDGNWTEVAFTVSANGAVTIQDAASAPLAVFVK